MEAASTSRRSLGAILVDRGLLSEQELEWARAEEEATNDRLTEILVRRGLVTGHDITAALMEQMTQLGPQDASPRPPLQAVPTASDDSSVASELDVIVDTDAEAAPPEETTAELSLLPLPDDADERLPETVPHSTEPGGAEARFEQIEATQERVHARRQSLADEIAHLQRTLEAVEQTSAELEQLKEDLAVKLDDLSSLRSTAAMWNSRIEDVEAEIGSLVDRIDSTGRELTQLVDASAPAAI